MCSTSCFGSKPPIPACSPDPCPHQFTYPTPQISPTPPLPISSLDRGLYKRKCIILITLSKLGNLIIFKKLCDKLGYRPATHEWLHQCVAMRTGKHYSMYFGHLFCKKKLILYRNWLNPCLYNSPIKKVDKWALGRHSVGTQHLLIACCL